MDSCTEIVETREVESVFCDQIENYKLSLDNTNLAIIEVFTADIIAGKELVLGQLVELKSYLDTTVYGSIPAIVTEILRTSPSQLVYTLTLLSGNLNGELTTIRLKSTQLEEAINPVPSNTDIIDGIKTTLLGKADGKEMKAYLKIPHIFVLNTDGKFTSYM